jgi:hypothetical protein
MVFDTNERRMNGCRQTRVSKSIGKNYDYPCPGLKKKMIVNFSSRDVVTFVYGDESWTSNDCNDNGWSVKNSYGEQVSTFVLTCQVAVLEANETCRTERSIAISNAKLGVFIASALRSYTCVGHYMGVHNGKIKLHRLTDRWRINCIEGSLFIKHTYLTEHTSQARKLTPCHFYTYFRTRSRFTRLKSAEHHGNYYMTLEIWRERQKINCEAGAISMTDQISEASSQLDSAFPVTLNVRCNDHEYRRHEEVDWSSDKGIKCNYRRTAAIHLILEHVVKLQRGHSQIRYEVHTHLYWRGFFRTTSRGIFTSC